MLVASGNMPRIHDKAFTLGRKSGNYHCCAAAQIGGPHWRAYKVPHVGWDQVHMTPAGAADPLLAGFAEGANMYFTHSYAVADDADAADVLARTHYTRSFPCIVRHGNVWGCQFHPEKSSALGQRILKNFVNIVEEAGR